MLTGFDFVLAALAALAAGAVNALAGGGTLITFPMLTFLGVPAVMANVTNTVALCPGYFGGTLAQMKDLQGQKSRLWLIVPASIVGGVLGGFLLLQTGEKLFKDLVPYLILLASGLLAIQDPVRAWLITLAPGASAGERMGESHGARLEKLTWLPVGLASIYGGYFGAGLSVIVLSALGLTLEDTLTRLNALKQAVAFSVNVAAAIFFIFSGQVLWSAAAVMALGALIGGVLGGKLAGKIKPSTLRWTVVTIGVIVAIIYFVRG
ncbi:MAG: sulfite exporter TauE/SafE family protein [Chloroflexi bacterium]|nr:sulfite exporter TauE/SafE family protein [Chloroflexota bacterium]